MADVAVAFDVASAERASALADACGDALTWAKIGPVLFLRAGPQVVRELRARGARVFLDLKWHDIPNTVAGAVEAAEELGVSLATVDLLSGPASLAAAVRARRDGLRLVGVGILTSLSADEFGVVLGRPSLDVDTEQARLVGFGSAAGMDGFVCAPPEVRRLRGLWPGSPFVVTPGIRRNGDAAGDQRRTATPAEAVRAGADLLVVGRPVTEARDPGAVLRAIRAEMAA